MFTFSYWVYPENLLKHVTCLMNISGCYITRILLVYHLIAIPVIILGQAMEICDNALDDDGDGFIDLNDNDCFCEVIEPVSRIPNPSFEEVSCCPQGIAELFCADGWIQASLTTTDLIHDCGWNGFNQFKPPRPFPDGQGIVGFRDGRKFDNSDNVQTTWKEYAGACLNAPLLAGQTYRFEFYLGFVSAVVSPAIDLTFFGTSSCDYMPYDLSDEAFGCPTNHPEWIQLSSIKLGSNRGWRKAQLDVTPVQDIYAIAIGPSCEPTGSVISTYYFLDQLLLDDDEDFTWVINGDNHPCSDDYELYVREAANHSYQWYKDGIAIIGENTPRLKNIDEGIYQVRINNTLGCFTTGTFHFNKPIIEEEVVMMICEGTSIDFGGETLTDPGRFSHTFTSTHGCDSLVNLKLEMVALDADTLYARIFKGDTYVVNGQEFKDSGDHSVSLMDDNGCMYQGLLILEYFDIYWPNAFSPNGDGNNDSFVIKGGPEFINIKSLSFYNRWGGLVFRGFNIPLNESRGWDGRIDGNPTGEGVYIFHATLEMDGGIVKEIFGSVLLVR